MLTMEPPIDMGSDAMQNEKMKVLSAIRDINKNDVVRGQFEGFLDEDYFIFSVSEKNMPSIWARRGKIDLRQTINDFENWGMHDHEIEFLEKACRHMRVKTQTRSNFIPNWLWM